MTRAICLLVLLCSSAIMAQSGPVFHWRLDESSGSTAIAAAGGSNGALAGGVMWDPSGGHHQGAARFDGVDDRIVLGACDMTTGGQAMSLSLWVKPDFVTGMERTLIAKTIGPLAADHVWSIAFVNATAMRFRLQTGGTTTELLTPPSSLFGGTWYHIVATYDGSEMRLYLNGSHMGSTAKTGLLGYHPQAPASIGAISTGSQPFSGWIDDARVYDRALSDSEVIELLFETITTSQPEAILYQGSPLLSNADPQQVDILDAMGHLLAHVDRSSSNAVDLSSLSAGIYLVCRQDHGTRTITRVVVP